MKTNGTRLILIAVFLQSFLLILSFSSNAQPDYTFNTPTLISGTDKLVGASYRYNNVRPGVDARVTITALTSGVTVVMFDDPSGYLEALQPTINVPANKKGYLEMKFDFLIAGTNISMPQLEVPATCIDVDGNSSFHEFDELNLGGGYVDYSQAGSQIVVTNNGNWFTGKNTGGVEYTGRDTAARAVMFTVVNANISSAIIRVGGDNLSGSDEQRLRSVYFKKFVYSASFLAKPPLFIFRGNEVNKKVELEWELIHDSKMAQVIIEKGKSPTQFKAIGEVWITSDNIGQREFHYTDNSTLEGDAFYRLRMIFINGNERMSNVLAFRSNTDTREQPFSIYPSVIQSSATINMKADRSGIAVVHIMDLSGRIVYQQGVAVKEGENNVVINGLDKLLVGNYVAVVQSGNNRYSQKIIKQ